MAWNPTPLSKNLGWVHSGYECLFKVHRTLQELKGRQSPADMSTYVGAYIRVLLI